MARKDLSTAGIKVCYAFETTAGTRPTGTYTHIPGIASIPAQNEEPNIIDSTTLDETVERVGISGLKGLPSATAYTTNYTDALKSQWAEVMESYETAKASGLSMWICIVYNGITLADYFPAEPSALGIPGADVDSVLQIDLYLTKTGEVVEADAPTSIVEWSAS